MVSSSSDLGVQFVPMRIDREGSKVKREEVCGAIHMADMTLIRGLNREIEPANGNRLHHASLKVFIFHTPLAKLVRHRTPFRAYCTTSWDTLR